MVRPFLFQILSFVFSFGKIMVTTKRFIQFMIRFDWYQFIGKQLDVRLLSHSILIVFHGISGLWIRLFDCLYYFFDCSTKICLRGGKSLQTNIQLCNMRKRLFELLQTKKKSKQWKRIIEDGMERCSKTQSHPSKRKRQFSFTNRNRFEVARIGEHIAEMRCATK